MNYTGGEVRHHKDCVFYPDSLSQRMDKLEKENEMLRQQLIRTPTELHRISEGVKRMGFPGMKEKGAFNGF